MASTEGRCPSCRRWCRWATGSPRIRTKHYTLHRRLGRVLVTAALVSVLFAFLFGLRLPWGGSVEAVATAVFGCWFLTYLLLAVRAIRRDDVVNHRRWMIRAFAAGVAVGTIRIWIGILLASGLLALRATQGGAPPVMVSSGSIEKFGMTGCIYEKGDEWVSLYEAIASAAAR